MSKKISVCLNMIVKNEAKNLPRLFDSVKDFITDYVISDTGSTDNTKDVIKEYWNSLGIKGHIDETPFKNFGYNRTVALKAAQKHSKSEFLMLLDADMVLVRDNFNPEELLDSDVISIKQKNAAIEWFNVRFLRRSLDMECVGVTHEYYDIRTQGARNKKLESIWINDIGDGGCKQNKFERDIALLSKGIEEDPKNVRYHFYLAQSYKDTGNREKAIEYYKKRIELGGWWEEVWYSHYMICTCYADLGKMDEAEKWAMKGFEYRPARSEALYFLCRRFREKGDHKKAYYYYNLGKDIKRPKDDVLFVEHNVYTHLFDVEFSILQYYLFPEKRIDGLRNSVSLLNNPIDFWEKNMIFSNIKFYIDTLKDKENVKITQIMNKDTETVYHNSTPCLIKLKNGKKVMNLRQVNYSIVRENGAYIIRDSSGRILTNNVFIELDDSRSTAMEYHNEGKYKNDTNILGVEDARIFERPDGNLGFIGVSKEYSRDQMIGIVTGDYHSDGKMIVKEFIESPDTKSTCEKNWVIGNSDCTDIIYKWHPLQIGNIEDGKLEVKRTIDTPKFFNYFRGSSCVCEYKGMKWFTVHTVHYETPRLYLHNIVVMDKDYNPLCYTLPFSFEGERIEYSIGLVIDNGEMQMSYSTWDSSSKIISVPLDIIFEKLVYVSEDSKKKFMKNLW